MNLGQIGTNGFLPEGQKTRWIEMAQLAVFSILFKSLSLKLS